MSIDVALLDRAEQQVESWLRLYRWEPRCLSFGRHEPAANRYNADLILAKGLDTVRRPTGGRAVWHERELTYAVAAPCFRFGSLRAAYQEIHLLLARALKALGIHPTLAPRTQTPALGDGACFAQPVGGEVLVDGRKIIGSAQHRRGSALLQHGSILLRDDQHRVSALLDPTIRCPEAAGAELRGGLEAEDLAEAVSTTARRYWSGLDPLSAELHQVLEGAEQHHPHFRSDAWTWAR
jgi:lipoyl(octanoyl) transferase